MRFLFTRITQRSVPRRIGILYYPWIHDRLWGPAALAGCASRFAQTQAARVDSVSRAPVESGRFVVPDCERGFCAQYFGRLAGKVSARSDRDGAALSRVLRLPHLGRWDQEVADGDHWIRRDPGFVLLLVCQALFCAAFGHSNRAGFYFILDNLAKRDPAAAVARPSNRRSRRPDPVHGPGAGALDAFAGFFCSTTRFFVRDEVS